LNSRTRLWQIGGTWGALPRAHRAYQVRRSVSVSNVAAVTTRQVNDRSPVTWWPLPRSVLPSKGATIARAGVVDWRRGPLDESKERATVTFQKRYSNGQKCRHHDDRGGGRVKEAERGIRQGKLQGRGIRRASSGLVLVCAFVLAALRLVPAQADSETSAVLTCAPNGTAMSKVELYFGTARNGRRPVSAPDWAHFVEAQIGPRFPEGFTALQGQGRWRTWSSSGTALRCPSRHGSRRFAPPTAGNFPKNRSCGPTAPAAYHSNRSQRGRSGAAVQTWPTDAAS
jgi:Protein of unknown function (DUF3574)